MIISKSLRIGCQFLLYNITTIDLILGLKSPDKGSTAILGMDAAKHRKKVFEKVGVQLQHTEYQNMMTVEEAYLYFMGEEDLL